MSELSSVVDDGLIVGGAGGADAGDRSRSHPGDDMIVHRARRRPRQRMRPRAVGVEAGEPRQASSSGEVPAPARRRRASAGDGSVVEALGLVLEPSPRRRHGRRVRLVERRSSSSSTMDRLGLLFLVLARLFPPPSRHFSCALIPQIERERERFLWMREEKRREDEKTWCLRERERERERERSWVGWFWLDCTKKQTWRRNVKRERERLLEWDPHRERESGTHRERERERKRERGYSVKQLSWVQIERERDGKRWLDKVGDMTWLLLRERKESFLRVFFFLVMNIYIYMYI